MSETTNFDRVVKENEIGFTEPLQENFRGHIKALGFDENTEVKVLKELYQEWWEMVKVDID